MAQTFDLVLKGGVLVNHDGAGRRDVGVANGRIAAIGDLSADRKSTRLNSSH